MSTTPALHVIGGGDLLPPTITANVTIENEWSGVMPCADVIVVRDGAMPRDSIRKLLCSAPAVIVLMTRLTAKTAAAYLRAGAIDCIRAADRERLHAVIDRELRGTERRRLVSRLRVEGLAAEFNNVLMGMQPYAELMQRSDFEPAVVAIGARHIASSIQRGKRVAIDMLRFSQPLSLGDLLTHVIASLVSSARAGQLTLRARRVEKGAQFRFGSVPDADRFVHLSVQHNGTGVGLELTHEIVARHDGHLFVESEPGRGTTFHLFLPAEAFA